MAEGRVKEARTVPRATQALPRRLARRLDAVPEQTRALLLLVALEGSGDLGVIARAAPRPGGIEHLAAAERLGLVSEETRVGFVRFRHPLVRDAVVESATEIDRRRAHRALAEAVVGHPDRRAWHLAEAAVGPDADLADLLERVGRGCLLHGDARGAVGALTRAAELSARPSLRGQRFGEAARISAAVTGRLEVASGLLDAGRALATGGTDHVRACTTRATIVLNSSGDVDRAHRLIVDALREHGGQLDQDDGTRVDALHTLFEICTWGARRELWEAYDEISTELLPVPPAPAGTSFRDPGPRRAERPRERLDAEIVALRDARDPLAVQRAATACLHVERVSSCRELLWRAVRDSGRGTPTLAAVSSALFLSIDDWFNGRWDEALALVEQSEEPHQGQAGDRFHELLRGYVRPLILVARGQHDEALASADRLDRWAAAHGVGLATHSANHVRALSASSCGDFEEAFRRASTITPPGDLSRDTPHALWVLLDLVESATRTGRRAEAQAHVAAMRAAAVDTISPRLAVVSAGCAALAASDDEALTLFEEAISVPGAERWPFDLGRVLLAYGEHLRGARLTEQAQDRLAAAVTIFERLGAHPWAGRAAQHVRALGRVTTRPSMTAAELLTPQELQIAILAASGLTNRQIGERLFVSHRTVGAYLYRVYPKLGVTSRAALHSVLAEAMTDGVTGTGDPDPGPVEASSPTVRWPMRTSGR